MGTSDVVVSATTAGALIFSGRSLELIREDANPSTTSLAVADLDGDRRTDVVTASFTRARIVLASAPDALEIAIDGHLRPWMTDVDMDGLGDVFVGSRIVRGSRTGAFSLGPRPGACDVIGVFDRSSAIDSCFVSAGMPYASSRWFWTGDGWSGPSGTLRANFGDLAM